MYNRVYTKGHFRIQNFSFVQFWETILTVLAFPVLGHSDIGRTRLKYYDSAANGPDILTSWPKRRQHRPQFQLVLSQCVNLLRSYPSWEDNTPIFERILWFLQGVWYELARRINGGEGKWPLSYLERLWNVQRAAREGRWVACRAVLES